MSIKLELDELSRALKRHSRRRLVISVLASAALTLFAAGWLFLEIRAQKGIEADEATLLKKTEFAEDIAKQLLEDKNDQGNQGELPVSDELPIKLTDAIRAQSRSISIAELSAESKSGYLVVLGSFQALTPALEKARQLRLRIKEPIRLFWAVNNYYAPVVGIMRTSEDALVEQRQLRAVVPDAYVFGAWAFPYELVEK